jgi:soluble lytic murein transglycosylase-like protein
VSVDADVAAVLRRMADIAGDAPPTRAAPGAGYTFAHGVARATSALVRDAARAAGVDPSLVAAVALTESGGAPNALSRSGAAGIMQLMPATAQALGVTDPYDATQNVRGGALYLRELLDRFGGDVRLALAAYNAGPGAVARFGGIPPFAETRTYVARVLDAYRRLRAP